MLDEILKTHSNKRKDVEPPVAAQTDAADDYGAFGWLRGVRDRSVMLEVRHKDGNVSAFGYSWLDSAVFDLSDGITLNFSGKKVTLSGQNLNKEVRPNVKLFQGLILHRVPWVQEADQPTVMEALRNAVIIENVEVK